MWFLLVFLIGLLVGLYIGEILTECKWRSNVDKTYPIEACGHLYKVKLDESLKQ